MLRINKSIYGELLIAQRKIFENAYKKYYKNERDNLDLMSRLDEILKECDIQGSRFERIRSIVLDRHEYAHRKINKNYELENVFFTAQTIKSPDFYFLANPAQAYYPNFEEAAELEIASKDKALEFFKAELTKAICEQIEYTNFFHYSLSTGVRVFSVDIQKGLYSAILDVDREHLHDVDTARLFYDEKGVEYAKVADIYGIKRYVEREIELYFK